MTIADDIKLKVKGGPLHFALIDPDKQDPKVAGKLARRSEDAGSSAIMVGGSTLVSQSQVDDTVKAIKDDCSLPVILFPSGAKFLSKYADALFFMSLLNSRNVDYIIREHVKGAPFAQSELQIVTPGGTVGDITQLVEDQPIFHEGKRVVIYFQKTDGEFHIVCARFGVEELGLPSPSPSH